MLDTIKQDLGAYAVRFIKNNMVVGLGTGSTANCFIDALALSCKKNLRIKAVASSEKSLERAQKQGISIIPFEQVTQIDITIDGADEVDEKNNLIKGAGGAHVREKILAHFSEKLLILVDETKKVTTLGETKPLPVEVVPFARPISESAIKDLCKNVSLRKNANSTPFVTDNEGYIFDLSLEKQNVARLHENLLQIPGVIDTGYFGNMAWKVIIGYKNGTIQAVN